APACARCAPFRSCRWRRWRASSCALPHQVDEDVFERALRGLQILEAYPGGGEVVQESRDTGALGFGVIAVDQLPAALRERQAVGGEPRRDCAHLLQEVKRQLLPAELLH